MKVATTSVRRLLGHGASPCSRGILRLRVEDVARISIPSSLFVQMFFNLTPVFIFSKSRQGKSGRFGHQKRNKKKHNASKPKKKASSKKISYPLAKKRKTPPAHQTKTCATPERAKSTRGRSWKTVRRTSSNASWTGCAIISRHSRTLAVRSTMRP